MKLSEISTFIAQWPSLGLEPPSAWLVAQDCENQVLALQAGLGAGYRHHGNCVVHESAIVEEGAVLKGAIIIGEGSFVASGAYLRGGVYLGSNCIVGPSCEIKSSFMLSGSKLAHFNFVGDSLIGEGVNIEAGAIIANYRNELDGADIKILHDGDVIVTGVKKFGALVGDGCKIGANAVIAPGALLRPNTHVPRLGLIDQFAYD
ncbi:Transferase LpxA family [Pseudomonas syringae pv. spinaceae]|uniref:Transferase LpxA family n=1 Tax=Pseudomonas syringae pv. spinaceae TaxID=264459 RepID=A0A0Q0AB60_PSESX|nr:MULTISPECIES: transferase [Pseudomonas syringae group]KPW31876.1 Transferase LpxA family [Pseudomonas syringae pv. apii]KPY59895.1 Transferase LpxA family [Pseudomonas syringae pv. spinaceae]RMT30645.1 Transferase LpxA family [Pseudomonas syringae pv. spinaceae]